MLMMANQVNKDLIEGRYAGKRPVVLDKTSYSSTPGYFMLN